VGKRKISDSAVNRIQNPLREQFIPTGCKVTMLSELQSFYFYQQDNFLVIAFIGFLMIFYLVVYGGIFIDLLLFNRGRLYVQGGSNVTGTDLCVNKAAVSPSYLNHLVITVWV
jgi:hypothetical protein